MRITSPDIDPDGRIPEKHTCEGDDTSPPLRFEDVPDEAETLALIVDDPDAPVGTFTHWLVWNLQPDREELQEDASGDLGDREGVSDFEVVGWRGPCPPEKDEAHRYRFILLAVDRALNLTDDCRRKDMDRALRGHVIEKATLEATYGQ